MAGGASTLATGASTLAAGTSIFPPVAHAARTDSPIARTTNPARVRALSLGGIPMSIPRIGYLLVAWPVPIGGRPVRPPWTGAAVSGSVAAPGSSPWAGAAVSGSVPAPGCSARAGAGVSGFVTDPGSSALAGAAMSDSTIFATSEATAAGRSIAKT
ncbi:MAG: hypothetical protein ACM32K_01945, partial [Syntrophaceae bacterium]